MIILNIVHVVNETDTPTCKTTSRPLCGSTKYRAVKFQYSAIIQAVQNNTQEDDGDSQMSYRRVQKIYYYCECSEKVHITVVLVTIMHILVGIHLQNYMGS
jgi:hypothetical protein